MPCSWPRSLAVTAWALRRISIYLMPQFTQLVPDVWKVRTLWNTGSLNVLELRWTHSWTFCLIHRERRCWCHGALFMGTSLVSLPDLPLVNNSSSSSSRKEWKSSWKNTGENNARALGTLDWSQFKIFLINPWPHCLEFSSSCYTPKQLLLSARLSHRNSVRPSVRL